MTTESHNPTLLESHCDEMAVGSSVPKHSGRPQLILIVDDDRSTRRASADVLGRVGYQVDTAENGEAAWVALQARSYGLLITDTLKPSLSGLELVARVRSKGLAMPVILASGETASGVGSLGLAAILPRPFSRNLLVSTVNAVLSPTLDPGTSNRHALLEPADPGLAAGTF